MKKQRHIQASTLSEMLIVLILSGIVLLSVFDGFSLFQRLLLRIQGRLDQSIERMDGYYRLESLFMGSDSIRGDASRLELYRLGIIRDEILIDDSLLIASRPEEGVKPDTLLNRVREYKILTNEDYPERIDSLLIQNDTTLLRLGIRIRPENRTETMARKVEQQYEKDENK